MKSNLSFSEFSLAMQCLRKYKHVVIDRLHTDTDDSADIEFGTAMHEGVNAYLEGDDGLAVFTVYWDSIRDRQMIFTRFDWAQLKELGIRLLARFEKKHVKHLKPFSMEKRLYGEYKGIQLEGTPDFFGTYQDIPVLIDWKTAAYRYPDEKLHTSLQLNLYAFLGVQKLGYRIDQMGYLVFVKSSETIQGPRLVDFSEKTMYDMLDDMVEYYGKMKKDGTYPRNPTACVQGSQRCLFIDRCWKGQE